MSIETVNAFFEANDAVKVRKQTEVFAENEFKVLIRLRGYYKDSNRDWIATHWYLVENPNMNIIWAHTGRLGLKQIEEMQTKHEFNTRVN